MNAPLPAQFRPAAFADGLLQFSQLGYRQGNHHLLRDIAGHIPAGSFTVLLGPNGAGKSTLLRLLAGLLPPSQGDVRLAGLPLHKMDPPSRARQLGWLGQFPAHDLPLTIEQYVLLGRRPALGSFGRPSPDDLGRVGAALAAYDISHLAQRRWSGLSGGERQRAGLARLQAQDAPIWLLDEPTNHLDLKHQAQLFRRLRNEATHGRTVIAVLHDIAQAARWADQVLLLGGGRLLAQGRPSEALCPSNLRLAYDCPLQLWQSANGHWHASVEG